ncbi:hypothetical protein BOW35_02205 [Solemya velum gill symbiont]|uniref:TorF family putative porin n=1 Tax=Solemya velum gill symbiont TaxID=2340 RepID=UPI000998E63C|nr:TorF family putative porin [Solemya velum gill symbiont]OOZ23477.1 hypothetical protein BOW30_02540 [Solemya velum gill symbiont]OOZ25562.1 hypothetical protein BOW31_02130 [Solemya velum gill symbiont]OOZ29212.1 hypothetical protein BOW33_06425 [Solemya velum gill symbiont]OOZ32781.1 hypothetical protein BOW34_02205 [Solemya velum gill symbiont]OOZ35009.1 hypothetical protein BOW35_02205 [Solemya velum gill symbiont]
MKKSYAAIACALAMTAIPTAQAEITANIGVTSNYLWRGTSQTDDAPAVSGGIDYAHESGFYLGTWASNIDWGTTGVELDIYGGYANELEGGLGYDVGLISYIYPSDDYDDSNFTELYLNLSYGPVSGGIAYTVAADWDDHSDLYYWASAGFEPAESWNISATVGHYDFEDNLDYSHGQVDITKSTGDFGDFTFTISKAEESPFDDDDLKVVVSWSKSF